MISHVFPIGEMTTIYFDVLSL